ncbi:MAG: acetolactate synthase [Armatimonadia bacterium]|nr:acetolactate synthase [Armatimonadia bacterium]
MFTKQVSVFLENRMGRLAEVCTLLGTSNINLRAFSTADTSEFGILRMIVNDPDRAAAILGKSDYAVQEVDVLAIQVDDRPGNLAKALEVLAVDGINVEYLYAFVTPLEGQAVVILRVADDLKERAVDLLASEGLTLLPPDRVYAI